jgi:hypothetical protein
MQKQPSWPEYSDPKGCRPCELLTFLAGRVSHPEIFFGISKSGCHKTQRSRLRPLLSGLQIPSRIRGCPVTGVKPDSFIQEAAPKKHRGRERRKMAGPGMCHKWDQHLTPAPGASFFIGDKRIPKKEIHLRI